MSSDNVSVLVVADDYNLTHAAVLRLHMTLHELESVGFRLAERQDSELAAVDLLVYRFETFVEGLN